MQLPLQTFTTLIQNMAAAVQSAATQLLDMTIGSTLRAVLEANASIALWMQWMLLQILQTTRAATSTGSDLDSWMADMSLTRLPAAAATGVVTFSRYTPALSALIPAGALVRTADGTETFAVIIDTTNIAWSVSQNGYVLGADVASLNVPVSAQTAGSGGNVQAGSVVQLVTAMPGIDTVTNASAFLNGLDAETDSAFRARFQNYIASRSRATLTAIGNAIASIQQGLQYTIQENILPNGSTQLGNFVVTVDDGSGAPATSLLSLVGSAIDLVRPIGTTFSVQPPTVIQAAISLTLNVPANVTKAPIAAAVGAATQSFINSLPVGSSLYLTRVAQIAYGTSSTVTNVTQLQVNGSTADLIVGVADAIKAGTVTVN